MVDSCPPKPTPKILLSLCISGITGISVLSAKSLQSCPTLCNPIDSSPPGSPVPGILQARILEWVATSFSNAWKWKVKVKSLSRVRLLATPWTAAFQAPPSVGFSRQEYWSGVPLASPWTSLEGPLFYLPCHLKIYYYLKLLLAEILLICLPVCSLIKQVSRWTIKHPHSLGSNPGFHVGQGCHVG